MKNFRSILQRTDVKLVQFIAYIGALIFFGIRGGLLSVLYIHLFFVFFYGILYCWQDFLIFLLAPLTAIRIPIENILLERYLKNFKQNNPAETVVILGQSDWFKLDTWIKPNFFKSEIKWLVQYLNTKKRNFSFYPKASIQDIKKIMADKSIKEVYFFGHGTSHTFHLNTDEVLYYCDFNDREKYGKEFVHQVHCGTPHGKSLIDYVVSEKNKRKCFLFRKYINSFDIEKEFKRRTRNILEKK
ncbi:MAG: hypothetical protein PHQ76_00075 [Caldisericia bacterium]|nr:hypothetical protein [Caldisericia bacterium]